jgi:YD repeat-containing protein
MNEDYGVKGSVHRLEQRKPCVPGLEHLRDHNSFDVEFSPSGQVVYLTQYSGAGNVFRSESHIYDESGKLARSLEFDSAESEAGTTDYEYDSDGKRVGWTRRDKSGTVTGRGIEEYAGKLLVSVVSFRANDVVVRRKTFEYADNRLVQSVSTYYGRDGEVSERWISTYDEERRIAETFGLKSDGKPLGDGRYVHEYDSEGRESRVLSFNDSADDNEPNHIKRSAYKCDEHDNWIERCEYTRFASDPNWRKTISTRRLTYYLPTT